MIALGRPLGIPVVVVVGMSPVLILVEDGWKRLEVGSQESVFATVFVAGRLVKSRVVLVGPTVVVGVVVVGSILVGGSRLVLDGGTSVVTDSVKATEDVVGTEGMAVEETVVLGLVIVGGTETEMLDCVTVGTVVVLEGTWDSDRVGVPVGGVDPEAVCEGVDVVSVPLMIGTSDVERVGEALVVEVCDTVGKIEVDDTVGAVPE